MVLSFCNWGDKNEIFNYYCNGNKKSLHLMNIEIVYDKTIKQKNHYHLIFGVTQMKKIIKLINGNKILPTVYSYDMIIMQHDRNKKKNMKKKWNKWRQHNHIRLKRIQNVGMQGSQIFSDTVSVCILKTVQHRHAWFGFEKAANHVLLYSSCFQGQTVHVHEWCLGTAHVHVHSVSTFYTPSYHYS